MEAFLVIAFREGLEAFLVLGIVLAFLQKRQLNGIKKFAWFGFFAGILASIILGFVFTVIIDGFESEVLQYSISLSVLFVAIVFLTYMVFWIQHNSEAANMRKKIELSVNQKLVTFLVVFSALLREGFETVLFSLASVMGGEVSIIDGFIGLSLGFAISGALVWTMFKGSIRLPIKYFFRYSSYFVLLIVAGLVSLLIKGLQAAEYLPYFVSPLFDFDSFISNSSIMGKVLGALIGYDAKPSMLQVVGWFSYLSIIYTLIIRKKQND